MNKGRGEIKLLLLAEYFVTCGDRTWHSYKYYNLYCHIRTAELFVLYQILEKVQWCFQSFPCGQFALLFLSPPKPSHVSLPCPGHLSTHHRILLLSYLCFLPHWRSMVSVQCIGICRVGPHASDRGVSQAWVGMRATLATPESPQSERHWRRKKEDRARRKDGRQNLGS